jgi:hypothetical protein
MPKGASYCTARLMCESTILFFIACNLCARVLPDKSIISSVSEFACSRKAIGRPHYRVARNTRSSLMWPDAAPVPVSRVPNPFTEITVVVKPLWSACIHCMTKLLPNHPNFGHRRGKPNSGPTVAFGLEKL